MGNDVQRELVFDALHYSVPVGRLSFVVNEPGLRLLSSDSSFLPTIKTVLLDVARSDDWRGLKGLSYVIGAFLVIGAKSDPATLVPLIESVQPDFAAEIVANIPTFFRYMEKSGTHNFGVAAPAQLIQFLEKLAHSDATELQKAAERARRLLKK